MLETSIILNQRLDIKKKKERLEENKKKAQAQNRNEE